MEEIVSFKTAKLAKEKGFNLGASMYYENSLTESIDEENGKSGPFGWEKGEINLQSGFMINNNKLCDTTNKSWYIASAPSQSSLQKWLREIHNIDVWAHPFVFRNSLPDESYSYNLYKDDVFVMDCTDLLDFEIALEEGLQKALDLIN